MTDNEKRAHDIAVAVSAVHLQPDKFRSVEEYLDEVYRKYRLTYGDMLAKISQEDLFSQS